LTTFGSTRETALNCTIAIVGGGLFGSGLALELVRKGIAVTLIDLDAVPVNRAARRNEGKVHLGFVYAQEDDARTAAVMIEGALAFRRIVASWIGDEAWRSIPSSTPYHYIIHRDSILDATRLAVHYAAVQRLYEEAATADLQGVDYLGDRPPSLWRPLNPAEVSAYRHASVQSGFATVERALDTDSLCNQLAAVVSATPAIRWVGGTHVEGVTNTGKGFELYGRRMGDRRAERFDFVVNAA
jgi:glycine/D-amino acid oxidase-like deaminating enzyme